MMLKVNSSLIPAVFVGLLAVAAADREKQQQMAYIHYAQVERSLGSISKNAQKIAETAALYSAIEYNTIHKTDNSEEISAGCNIRRKFFTINYRCFQTLDMHNEL